MIAGAIFTALVLGAPPDDDAPTLTWRTDLAAAREVAARERKPMIVVFRCVP